MNKYLLAMGLIVFSFVCANSLLAQDVQDVQECNKLKEELKELSKQNEKLKKDTASLSNELRKMQKSLDKQKKKNSKPELDAIIQMQKDSTSKELYAKAQEEIKTLQGEVDKLTPFRDLQVRKMLECQNSFLSMPFSQLKTDTLKQVIEECNRYKVADEEIAKGIKLFETLLNDKITFDSISSLLDTCYNEARINEVRSESGLLGRMLKSYKNKPQFNEIDTLDIKLSHYKSAFLALKDFIISFNEQVKYYRDNKQSKAVTKNLEEIIKENDTKETIALIEEIPYLKKQLGQYIEDITKEPLKKSKIEELGISEEGESVH